MLDAFSNQVYKLSALGVTVVASSGDNGAIQPTTSSCICEYSPVYPASCPLVTAVGATQGAINVVPDYGEGEVACQVSF